MFNWKQNPRMNRASNLLSVRGWVATCVCLLACKVSAAGDPDYVQAARTGRCAPGYQHRGGSVCVPLVVPANAHVDSSGHDWECSPGYRKKGKVCERAKALEVAAALKNHPRIVAPPPCNDHRDTNRSGRSPDILRRCE